MNVLKGIKNANLIYTAVMVFVMLSFWVGGQDALALDETYEAEEADVLLDAVVDDEYGGYSGSGFVDYQPNEPDGYIEWEVNVPSGGDYTLEFGYAHGGSDGDRPGEVAVDGSVVDSGLAFNETGGWDEWDTTSLTTSLDSGDNTVRLTGVGNEGGANVDYLRLHGDGQDEGEDERTDEETHEAEDAAYEDAIVDDEHDGYTGSGYVDYNPNEPGGHIEWQVDAPSSGTYRLHFSYAHGGSDGDRPGEVEVNGSLIDSGLAFVPTDDWDDWEYTGLSTHLEEGSNSIRLTGVGDEGGANIDHLWIPDTSQSDSGDDDSDGGNDDDENVGSGDSYYVATDGSDSNDGSESSPFATIEHAVSTVEADDNIYLRDGTYELDETIDLDENGTSTAQYHLLAYEDETPILDFSDMADDDANRGIEVHGNYWHLKGFTVEGAGDNGIYVEGAHNLLEELDVLENQDAGVQLHTGASDNTIRNVDSYYNYDPANHGENADGFAAKFDIGSGNVFEGCRAWNNSDDGYDFWEANADITVRDTWIFRNGVNTWDDSDFQGDGNGIKLGRGDGAHTIQRAVIWENPGNGVDHNKHDEATQIHNVTAYANATRDSGKNNFQFSDSRADHELRNNISHDGPISSMDGVDDEYNDWNIDYDVSDSDFISVDDTGTEAPRNADGSLPDTDFLKLESGSGLIDAGTDVGLSYEGSAPDLGANEKE